MASRIFPRIGLELEILIIITHLCGFPVVVVVVVVVGFSGYKYFSNAIIFTFLFSVGNYLF